MDKFIRLFGFVQNYVTSSRRNGSTERAGDFSAMEKNKNMHLPQDESPKAGLKVSSNSSREATNDTPSAAKDIEDGEVEEVKSKLPRSNAYVLPAVDSAWQCRSDSTRKIIKERATAAAPQVTSAASPGRLNSSLKKQDTLPSFNAAQDLSRDQIKQQKGRKKDKKDLHGSSGFPDIFTTVGKSLVQLRERSIPYVPVSRKISIVTDPPGVDPNVDDWHDSINKKKLGLKLPRVKGESKKKRNDGDDAPSGTGKEIDSQPCNPAEGGGGKVCAEGSRCGTKPKGERSPRKRTTSVQNERHQRPGTALGRWMKKRNNSVAPAPLDDSSDHDSRKAEKEAIQCSTSVEKNVSSSPRKEEPAVVPCSMVFVAETTEKISMFVVKAEEKDLTSKTKVNQSANDNSHAVQEQAQHETTTTTALTVLDSGRKDTEKSTVSRAAKIAEELTNGGTKPEAQTSQGSLNERLKNVPARSARDDTSENFKRLDNQCDSVGRSSAFTSGARGNNGRETKLIDLEMKSGIFEPPSVSKKIPARTSKTKQRVERTCVPVINETKTRASTEWFQRKDSPPQERKKQSASKRKSKVRKKVRFNLKPDILGETSSSATGIRMSSFMEHSWAARKPTTYTQQFQVLANSDCSFRATNSQLPMPDFKPKWHGGRPCLPSIRPARKQMADDFLDKQRRTMEPDIEAAYEGWGVPETAEELKHILERPMTAKLPRDPAQWGPLPIERPSGRGGQGYSLGAVLWKKPERSFLSDQPPSAADHSEVNRQEEVLHVSQNIVERSEPPRWSVFADNHFTRKDSGVQESATWCRVARSHGRSLQQAPSRHTADEQVALIDMEDIVEF